LRFINGTLWVQIRLKNGTSWGCKGTSTAKKRYKSGSKTVQKVKNTNLEIYKMDLDISEKIKKWKGAFDTEYLGIIENQKLLSEYHQKIISLKNEIELKQNQQKKIGTKLFLFSVLIIACNALITALILKL